MNNRTKTILKAAALAALMPCTAARAALSFNVDASTFGTDTARYNAAVAAMTAVVSRYNVYGDFGGYNIPVIYDSTVATADSGYLGTIRFGGTYPNERVAQHESNHYLGSGTYYNWYNLFNSSGVWTGPRMSQLIQQFDGDGAVIRQSGVHFYGYGLNYDSEVTDNSIFMRNIALMYAMRADMGNGNTANPWSATSVTLTASDPAGTSAFNWFGGGYSGTYQGWSDKYFAHAGAAYSTGAFDIRTPNGYPSWTFAGDSLTVNSGGRLLFNGYGTAGVVTINNLVLDGGTVRHDQYSQDLFQLAGNVTLKSTSTFEAANGNIRVLSAVGGTGGLVLTGGYTTTLANINTYTGGTTVNAGTLALANGGAAGAIRGTLNINSGATVKLTAADALGFGTGASVTQINVNGGTLDNATSGNNGYLANWNLTGGKMTASGGGTFHINAGAGNGITSNASATTSLISGNVAIRGANSVLPISVADGTAATDLQISGTILNSPYEAGANGISKTGPGTLILSGPNAYTGTTTVSAGTLGFAASQSNVGPVSVASGAALKVGAAGANSTTLTSTSLSLAAGNTLSLDFTGIDTAAPLISTGTFTANGTINVSLQNTGALSSGTHSLVAYTGFAGGGSFTPAAFTLGPRSTGTLSNDGVSGLFLNVTADRPIWTGRDNGNWASGLNGTLKNWKLQTAASATDYLEGDNVLFDDTAAGSTTVALTGNVTPAAVTFNNSAKTYTVGSTGGYGIAGNGALTKNGSGTVTLSTANTFSGAVTLNSGTLYATLSFNPSDNAAFSYVSGITVNNGATLKAGLNSLFGYSGANDRTITVNAGGTLTTDTQGDTGVGLVVLNGGTMTTGGANANAGTWRFQDASSKLYVTDNATVSGVNYKFQNGAPIDVAAGKTLNFTGTITDTNSFGASSLVKNGGGTLVLAGSNTFTGGATINAGAVVAGSSASLGSDTAPVVLDGGTLRTTAGIATARSVTVNAGGGTINIASSGVNGTGQFYLSAVNALLGSGPLLLTGNGTLNTTGAGNLRLGNANTYSGVATVSNGGVFEYGAAGAVGGGATFVLGNEGELAVQGYGTTAMPNAVVVNGGTNSVLSFENSTGGTASGPITLNANLTVGLRNWYNYANVTGGAISGVISGNGGLTVNSGAGSGGTLALTAYNTFAGNVTIANATVTAGSDIGNVYTNSNLGTLVPAAARSITINGGGNLTLTGGNVFGTGGSTNTLSNVTLTLNGGAFQTGLNGTGSGWWNKIGNVVLNNGSIQVGSGANTTNFQALALIGTVTVTGTTASTVAPLAASDATSNGVHLGQNAAAGQAVTFNVADATGDANPDLTISARLLNTSASLAASGLTKTGPGTLSLTGADAYTGVTTVSAGTLRVKYAATGTSAASPLLTGAGGTNLQNGQIVFDYAASTTPAATIRGLLRSSYTSGSGVMNGGELRSSTAAANRGLGYADDGTSQLTVMATLFGDSDLDGGVSINDFNALAANFGQTGKVWTQGDFDYDGGVSINDFNLLAANFGKTLGSSSDGPNFAAVSLWDFAVTHDDQAAFIAATGVPEPAAAGLLAGGALLGLRRRRTA